MKTVKNTLIRIVLAAFCLGAVTINNISAQNNPVLYFMNLPQNHTLNPALRPTNKVYIGLPGISGTAISMNNNFLNFSDVIIKGGPSDSLITFLHPDYDKSKFMSKIRDKNSIEPEFMTQLFGLGFTAGKSYIFLDINERASGNLVIPGDLLRVALLGNGAFIGKSIDFSAMRSEARIYHEIGFGFSRNYTEKLRLGFKAKALFGVMAANMDNRLLEINVGEDYSHTLNADLTYNFSAPHTINNDVNAFLPNFEFDDSRLDGSNAVSYLTGTGNMGFGADFGMSYQLGKKLFISAAVTDLGFIKWKRDVQNQTVKGQYKFTGFDVTDILSGDQTFDDVANSIADSLDKNFKPVNSANAFTTYLPFNVTAAASYSLTRHITFGVLSNSRIVGKQLKQNLTMSANINLGNALSTTLTYTAANHRYDNIGAGLAFRLGWIQFYALTDRIPIVWNKLITDNGKGSVYLPASWNSVDFRFGMNLVFGNRIRKSRAVEAEVKTEEAPAAEN